jgi:hypothetical protein
MNINITVPNNTQFSSKIKYFSNPLLIPIALSLPFPLPLPLPLSLALPIALATLAQGSISQRHRGP